LWRICAAGLLISVDKYKRKRKLRVEVPMVAGFVRRPLELQTVMDRFQLPKQKAHS
jgi:hypothetical protein